MNQNIERLLRLAEGENGCNISVNNFPPYPFYVKELTVIEELCELYKMGLIKRSGEVPRKEEVIEVTSELQIKVPSITEEYAKGYTSGKNLFLGTITERICELIGDVEGIKLITNLQELFGIGV